MTDAHDTLCTAFAALDALIARTDAMRAAGDARAADTLMTHIDAIEALLLRPIFAKAPLHIV